MVMIIRMKIILLMFSDMLKAIVMLMMTITLIINYDDNDDADADADADDNDDDDHLISATLPGKSLIIGWIPVGPNEYWLPVTQRS